MMRLRKRFDTLEADARGRLARAFTFGNEKLVEIDRALARVASDDFSPQGLRQQVERLRARAEALRADAVRRAGELPGEAVSRLATSTRTPVQTLAKGLAEIAKRMEPPVRPVARADVAAAENAEPVIARAS